MMKNTAQQSMMSSQTGGQNRMGMMNLMGVHSRSPLGNPGMEGQGNMLPPQHGMVPPGQQNTMPGGNHMNYPGPHHMMGQEQQHLQQPQHGMNPNMMPSSHHGNMMPPRGPVTMETLPPAANQNGTVMTSSGGRPMPMRGGGMDSSPTGYHSSASLVTGHTAPPNPHAMPPSPTSVQMQPSHGYPGLTPAQGRQYQQQPQNPMRQPDSHDHPYHRQPHQQTPPPQTHRGPFPDPPKLGNPDGRVHQQSRPVGDMGSPSAGIDSKPSGQSKQLVMGFPKSPTVTLPKQQMAGPGKSDKDQAGTVASEGAAGGAEASTDTSKEQESVATNLPESTLANTKEKTPMCLINELARYNKVQHQYMLVDEQGPAHKKTFFVKLKLGTEEYSSNGQSIKKAQHAAAEIALEKTMYKHPPPRPARSSNQNGWNKDNKITPTMELNALATKREEPTEYKLIRQPRFQPMYMNQRFEYPQEYQRGMYNQRYQYRRMPWTYISLKVGAREFIGEGPTPQTARHNAAEKALRILNRLPMPVKPVREPEKEKEKASEEDDDADDESDEIDDEEKKKNGIKLDDELKSEISLVYEIAVREKLHVIFEVIAEAGPPHLKTFTCRCVVGKINAHDSTFTPHVTINADGSSKKIAKKKAALAMFEALKKKYQSIPSAVVKPKLVKNKKKNRNLIKVQKAEVNYGSGINPISRLIQIMQAQKKKDPLYTLIEEKALLRRREFIMEVRVDEYTCTGSGPNKKLAKRSAAEAMLKMLGYSKPSPQPSKPALKSTLALDATPDKKVTFVEGTSANTDGGKLGRQIMPGLLLLNDSAQAQSAGFVTGASGGGAGSGDANSQPSPQQPQQTKGGGKEVQQSPSSRMGSGDGPQQKASSMKSGGDQYSSLKNDKK